MPENHLPKDLKESNVMVAEDLKANFQFLGKKIDLETGNTEVVANHPNYLVLFPTANFFQPCYVQLKLPNSDFSDKM